MNILDIKQGSHRVELESTVSGGLRMKLSVQSSNLHGGQSISMMLAENDVRDIYGALSDYIASRKTQFNVGDIVYEPNHYKRAGEVIQIMEDRITFGAPYHIRFIDQAKGSPSTDYFAADNLVLVLRKGE